MDASFKITLGALALLLLVLGLTHFGSESDSRSSGYGTKLVADPPTITVIESAKSISWDDAAVEPEVEEPSTKPPQRNRASAPEREPDSASERRPARAERPETGRAQTQAHAEAQAPASPPPTPSRPGPKRTLPRAFLLRTRMVVTKVGSGVAQPSVVAALQSSIKSVELCVEEVAKAARRQISGSIPVSAQIDADGRLRPLTIRSPYAGSEACLRKVYAQTDFPRSSHGSASLEFTLEFETSN